MTEENNKTKLIAGVAIAALVLGGGGIMLGRSVFAPAPTTAASAESENAEEKEEGHVEGQVEIDAARAQAAGIVTETIQSGGLGAEIPVSYTHLDVYKRQIWDGKEAMTPVIVQPMRSLSLAPPTEPPAA